MTTREMICLMSSEDGVQVVSDSVSLPSDTNKDGGSVLISVQSEYICCLRGTPQVHSKK